MYGVKFIPLILKYLFRHRVRSLLTLGGIASAMFLFYSVQAMQQGVRESTDVSAKDTKLVVYRQNRYCPFTSNLPQDYASRIAKIPGVRTVTPVKVLVSNCRTSLDVVTFRGIPVDAYEQGAFKTMRIVAGSLEDWKRRSDAAIIGERIAARRGLKPGDRIDIGGVTIFVAGIFKSPEIQDRNVGYAHLDFIQRAADNRVGMVTQFDVKVTDPGKMESVAKAIDEQFQSAREPTTTWSEKGLVSRAASDILEIVNFTKWLGVASLVGIFALVFNAIVLSVQDRIKDHAIMQTLGYPDGLIARLIIAESMILSIVGGCLGIMAGYMVTTWGQFSLSVEGVSIHIHAGMGVVLLGLGVSAITGILAGLAPAWQASRREIAACFRAV